MHIQSSLQCEWALRHAEEEKLWQVEEQEEEKKRARAEIERVCTKYCLSSDSETQTPPDQLSTFLAEIEYLKSVLKSSASVSEWLKEMT